MSYTPIYYTGIGSRGTPFYVRRMMYDMAATFAAMGYILRSGAAEGADSAFQGGHYSKLKYNMEIYLPWKSFGYPPGNCSITAPDLPNFSKALEIAEKVHPAWGRVSYGARNLHARNIYQVLGIDLDTPSSIVYCWTKLGKDVGGTRTAISVARSNGIPVVNLYDVLTVCTEDAKPV